MPEMRCERMRTLLSSLRDCHDYTELSAKAMDGIAAIVPSRAWGMYRLDGSLLPTDIAARNVSDAFLLRYEEVGRGMDPMMQSMISSHLPSHNLQPLSREEWLRHPLYVHITSRLGGLEHVLQAPLLGDGRIVGTLNFGRFRDDVEYGDQEVAAVSALAHHLSALLATLPEAGQELGDMTDRELEIARLVAAGLNNVEIAECLSISRNTVKEALKRIFRKADVDSRAELAARLTAARK